MYWINDFVKPAMVTSLDHSCIHHRVVLYKPMALDVLIVHVLIVSYLNLEICFGFLVDPCLINLVLLNKQLLMILSCGPIRIGFDLSCMSCDHVVLFGYYFDVSAQWN